METAALKYMGKKLAQLQDEFQIQYALVYWVEQDISVVYPSYTKIDISQLYHVIQKSSEHSFINKSFFPGNAERCLVERIEAGGSFVGFVAIAGSPRALEVKSLNKSLHEAKQLAAVIALCDKIKRRSLEKWKQETIMMGVDPAFVAMVHRLEQLTNAQKTIFITGESGVGKEVFARSIYLLGQRFGKPYVSVNCGQFQDEHLLISELFGHKRGSFTGAAADRRGVFETANTGVIFLDEVAELSLNAQKMLLRVIEYGEVRPLGAEKTIHVDVQIISATHRGLEDMISDDKFREDLYYRLNVLPLQIPPLRERREDILILLDYFLNKLNVERAVQKEYHPNVIEYFQNYSFPGNVRELKNIVETGFWLSNQHIIALDDMTTKIKRLRGRRNEDVFMKTVLQHYARMVEEQESFWTAVREPFLNRDLNRREVKAILTEGLKKARNYKELIAVFNVEPQDYKKFLNFLQDHDLKPDLAT